MIPGEWATRERAFASFPVGPAIVPLTSRLVVLVATDSSIRVRYIELFSCIIRR